MLIGGAAVVETIFALPGLGYTLLQAITVRDYPLVQATILFIAVVFVLVNLLVDIALRRCSTRGSRSRHDRGHRDLGARPAPAWLSLPARWRNPIGLVGAGVIALVVFTALFGHFIWSIDPDDPVYDRLQGPSWAHPMGTDDLGRDTLARIIHGAGVSLQVGATAIGIALLAGTIIGLTRRLLPRRHRPGADARRRHPVRLPEPDPRLPDRRPARPERRNAMIAIGIDPHPRLRPRRPRRGARGDGLPLHRVGAGARRRRPADHGPARGAEHRRAADRADDRLLLARRSSPRRRSASSASAPSRRRRRGATCSRPRASSSTRASGCRSSRASRS